MSLPISVIIPHYNRPESVIEAVESVRAQTRPPDEIIIVDDCSTAENREKLRKLNTAARIHFNEENLGAAETRNVGTSLARNRWLAFLDDDDLYHPWKLELQVAHLSRHPECDIVGGPLWHVAPDGSAQIWGYREERRLSLRDGLLYTASSLCTMLIHRNAYWKVGGMARDFRHMSDLEFGIRLLAGGCHMRVLPEPLVTYRHGGHVELSLNWAGTCAAHFRIVHRHRRHYQREFGTWGTMQEYARRAKFYGLRKGRLIGRSLWAAGCLAQAMVGKAFEEPAANPGDTRHLLRTGSLETARPLEDPNTFQRVGTTEAGSTGKAAHAAKA